MPFSRTISGKRRILLLIFLMTSVVLAVTGIVFYVLYQAAFAEQQNRLTETVKSQARLIEAVARFDKQHTAADYPGGAMAATLSQIRQAHARLEGYVESGEFTLGRREGDQIEFLLRRHYDTLAEARPTSFVSKLDEPMRRALSGDSGTAMGSDYRGVTVLAAYEPVAVLDWGIVAKVDLAEIRRPFITAGLWALGGALVLVVLGSMLLVRIGTPMVVQMEESEEHLELALQAAEIGTWDWNIKGDSFIWDDHIHPLLGLEAGAFSGTMGDFIQMLHPEDRERFSGEINEAITGGAELDTEFRVIWPDGSEHYLTARGKVYRDREGQALRITGVVWDITEAYENRANSYLVKPVDFDKFTQLMDDMGFYWLGWNRHPWLH